MVPSGSAISKGWKTKLRASFGVHRKIFHSKIPTNNFSVLCFSGSFLHISHIPSYLFEQFVYRYFYALYACLYFCKIGTWAHQRRLCLRPKIYLYRKSAFPLLIALYIVLLSLHIFVYKHIRNKP